MARPKKTNPDATMQADIENVLKAVPKGLPFYLEQLTTAGHLLAAGYNVQEDSLHEDGLPGRALIFAPVMIEGGGSIAMMFEIRMNLLLTMQEAADECGVNYRSIQRWRDEGKIFAVTRDGKQLFPSAIVKEFAERQRSR